MYEASVKLVFRGGMAPGHHVLQVRAKVCALLKIDAGKADLMFDGRTTVLKKNLSIPDAQKFQQIFDATGALSLIEPDTDSAVTTTTPPPLPPLAPSSHPVPPPDDPVAEQPKQGTFSQARNSGQLQIVPGIRGYRISGLLILLVGVCFLGFGGWKGIGTAGFVSSSAFATGTVTGFATSRSGGSRSATYAPEVMFRAPSGRLIRFRSQLGSNILWYRSGDRVAVRYDAADPHHAEIDGFMPLWGLTIILLLIGAALTAFGRRMLAVQRRAQRFGNGVGGWTGVKGEQVSCPSCGFRQPVSNICRACNCDFTRVRERMAQAERFSARFAGKAAGIRFVVILVSLSVAMATFAWQWWSMTSAVHTNRIIPTIWTDSDHRYEFAVPVDWQIRSNKDAVVTFPLLRSEPPVMYQLIATSMTPPTRMLALGVSGITPDRVGALGWEAILSEMASGNTVQFSDVVQSKGLTVHRVGYQTLAGYREDAYFEAGRHVIMVCFTVPLGADLSEQVKGTRNLIMDSLTGT
jgi:hypothetical protein